MAKDTKSHSDATKDDDDKGKATDTKKTEAELALLEKQAAKAPEPEPAPEQDEAFVKAALAAQDTYESVIGLMSADVEDERGDLKKEFIAAADFVREFSDVPASALPFELKRRKIGDKKLHADDDNAVMAWGAFIATFRMVYKMLKDKQAEKAPQTGQPEAIPMHKRGKIRSEAYAATGFRAKR